MSDFTISITDWYMSQGGDISSTSELPGEEYIVASYPITGEPGERHLHAIPLSGIAFRMEMLGSSDPVETFELTIRELNTPAARVPQDLYPKVVNTYYRTSTDVARALTSSTSFRAALRAENGPRHEVFLSQVRGLLRGTAPTVMAEEKAVSEVMAPLRTTRTGTLGTLRSAAQHVPIEETAAVKEIRNAVSSKISTLTTMTDVHAHRAMELGAYFYARSLI